MTGALKSTYAGKSVLVTGHTGFKGVWLTAWLARMGAKVSGLALAPQTPFYDAVRLDGDCSPVIGDIRERRLVADVFTAYSPEIVFHMAAQSLVGASYDDPAGTFETNLLGTVNVMEAARHCKSVRALVMVTTDKVYRNTGSTGSDGGYREGDPLGGNDAYSASKACAEISAHAYRRAFFEPAGVALATARAGNVIGGGDWAARRLVPDFVRAIETGRPLVIRRPDAVRPWQFVLEPLRGYLELGRALLEANGEASSAFNFGPDMADAIAVRDLAAKIVRAWGAGEVVEKPETADFHEERILFLDAGKAAAVLGWKPRLDVDAALRRTVAWYKGYADNPGKARDLILGEIDAYDV